LSTIDNENRRKILANGAKYRKPQSMNWKYNLNLSWILWRQCQNMEKTRKREG